MPETSYKTMFQSFLQSRLPAQADALLPRFEQYLDLLYTKNQIVNMVSRRMNREEYWLYHFLDSLLILKCMEFSSGSVLDFGSGGGLPGIPMKLAFPDLQMTLLDSVGKKVTCMQEMADGLGLKGCKAVWSRLEDFPQQPVGKRFDFILCRAVQMEDRFVAPLLKLLGKDGKVIFYKAHKTEDVTCFPGHHRFDVSLPELGTRQIIVVPRRGLYIKAK